MSTQTLYELDLKACPKEFNNRAIFRLGRWIENRYGEKKKIDSGEKWATLTIQGYDGSAQEKPIEWHIDYPLDDLLEEKSGTWLVPIGISGSFMLSDDEEIVKKAILDFAEEIWFETRKSPNIETIRLDDKTSQKLRIYSFWFPFRGHEPIIESQPLS